MAPVNDERTWEAPLLHTETTGTARGLVARDGADGGPDAPGPYTVHIELGANGGVDDLKVLVEAFVDSRDAGNTTGGGA